jgi:hypothetical protein
LQVLRCDFLKTEQSFIKLWKSITKMKNNCAQL